MKLLYFFGFFSILIAVVPSSESFRAPLKDVFSRRRHTAKFARDKDKQQHKKMFAAKATKSDNEIGGISEVSSASDISDPNRRIWVVTTASLPWMTGTAVNPLLRAAYLTRGREKGKVTLMVPWIDQEDQDKIFPGSVRFMNSTEQRAWVHRWLAEEAGLRPESSALDIRFYTGRYHESYCSIFPMGDITRLIPEEEADVCVLEEPEHLNWFRASGDGWSDKFAHVVGVIHTNYLIYSRGEQAGRLKELILRYVNIWVARAYSHKIIRLSAALQSFAEEKEVVSNVHGVRESFLNVGDRAALTKFNEGAYFLGKALWAKGHDRLISLLRYAVINGGENFNFDIDVYGSGRDRPEIEKRAGDAKLNLHFFDGIDHVKLTQYKVLVNPSVSEVLCTTVAEALAMGKFVLIAKHPSNEFFYQFPNCLTFSNPKEFVSGLAWALSHDPQPLTPAQRHTFTWEAATERFIKASEVPAAVEAARKSRLDKFCAWSHKTLGYGETGDVMRTITGAANVAEQTKYQVEIGEITPLEKEKEKERAKERAKYQRRIFGYFDKERVSDQGVTSRWRAIGQKRRLALESVPSGRESGRESTASPSVTGATIIDANGTRSTSENIMVLERPATATEQVAAELETDGSVAVGRTKDAGPGRRPLFGPPLLGLRVLLGEGKGSADDTASTSTSSTSSTSTTSATEKKAQDGQGILRLRKSAEATALGSRGGRVSTRKRPSSGEDATADKDLDVGTAADEATDSTESRGSKESKEIREAIGLDLIPSNTQNRRQVGIFSAFTSKSFRDREKKRTFEESISAPSAPSAPSGSASSPTYRATSTSDDEVELGLAKVGGIEVDLAGSFASDFLALLQGPAPKTDDASEPKGNKLFAAAGRGKSRNMDFDLFGGFIKTIAIGDVVALGSGPGLTGEGKANGASASASGGGAANTNKNVNGYEWDFDWNWDWESTIESGFGRGFNPMAKSRNRDKAAFSSKDKVSSSAVGPKAADDLVGPVSGPLPAQMGAGNVGNLFGELVEFDLRRVLNSPKDWQNSFIEQLVNIALIGDPVKVEPAPAPAPASSASNPAAASKPSQNTTETQFAMSSATSASSSREGGADDLKDVGFGAADLLAFTNTLPNQSRFSSNSATDASGPAGIASQGVSSYLSKLWLRALAENAAFDFDFSFGLNPEYSSQKGGRNSGGGRRMGSFGALSSASAIAGFGASEGSSIDPSVVRGTTPYIDDDGNIFDEELREIFGNVRKRGVPRRRKNKGKNTAAGKGKGEGKGSSHDRSSQRGKSKNWWSVEKNKNYDDDDDNHGGGIAVATISKADAAASTASRDSTGASSSSAAFINHNKFNEFHNESPLIPFLSQFRSYYHNRNAIVRRFPVDNNGKK